MKLFVNVNVTVNVHEPALDPCCPFAHDFAVGKQYNKSIKKRRRLRYLKRKKEAKKAGATKPAAG